MNPTQFDDFFRIATTHTPFAYQRRLAEGDGSTIAGSLLINVPTGLGKTAAVVIAWLWNLVEKRPCPRRLVYCLPMRTLVEQTRDNVAAWLSNLSEASSSSEVSWLAKHSPVILMGGEDNSRAIAEWGLWPEKPCILIGTQDMLLSRALNRGYGAGRARWPKDFALLNNDCLWVFDEVQLMGSGFATSLQLQAWREELRLRDPASGFRIPRPTVSRTHSWWMSATLDRDWLQHGVDYRKQSPGLWAACEKESGRFWSHDAGHDRRVEVVLDHNRKSLHQVPANKKGKASGGLALRKGGDDQYLSAFADTVIDQTREAKPGRPVLAILNTVARATKLAEKLISDKPVLLHSRFRAREREEQLESLKGARLVIATQVVEAGVDISASVLFTEACPWPSLIQRLGRCARGFGTDDNPEPQRADVFWTDVSAAPAPYTEDEIQRTLNELAKLKEANLGKLKEHADALTNAERRRLLPYEPRFVPRDKDLFDLFDTTPDLTGADVDISRFIRDTDDLDVQVFWRDASALRGSANPPKKWRPQHAELCPVPCRTGDQNFKDFARSVLQGRAGRIWRWDYKNGWTPLSTSELDRVYPGQIFLLEPTCGGYDTFFGWTAKTDDQPWGTAADLLGPWGAREVEDADDSDESDKLSETGEAGEWRTILTHTREVCEELSSLFADTGISLSVSGHAPVLRLAARLHDWGKVHPAFQAKLKPAAEGREQYQNHYPVAKAPDDCWRRGRLPRNPADEFDVRRAGFRHELASSLAVLELLRMGDPCHKALIWPDAELRGHFAPDVASPDVQLPAQALSLFNELSGLTAAEFDLLLYTIAAHHGKVRMSLRSAPDDIRVDVPDPCPADEQQARGVRNGDTLPAVSLPGSDSSVTLDSPEVMLHLDPMELGLGARYGRSWRERTQNLLETHGPFQLAWLEAILRVADGRASRKSERHQ